MTAHDAMRRTLDRTPLPAGFHRWRLTLAPGEERQTGAAEWAGALVVVECGRLEVECRGGTTATYPAGSLLALGWLPAHRLTNVGPDELRLLAVRRRSDRSRTSPGEPPMTETPNPPRRTGPKHPPPADIDAYLAPLPEDQRAALQALRETIRAAVPEATEVISYSAPAFRYHGMLVSFTAARNHCTFHLMGTDLLPEFAAQLEGYALTKGGVHFTPERPIPADLVTRMVRAKAERNEAAAARKEARPCDSGR